MDNEKPEGWQVYLTPGNRKAHYFVGSDSLCQRVGFYLSELEKPGTQGGKSDCAKCRNLIGKRAAAPREGE